MSEFSGKSLAQLVEFAKSQPKKIGVVVRIMHHEQTYVIPLPEQDKITSNGIKVDAVFYKDQAPFTQYLDKAMYGTIGGGVDEEDESIVAAAHREWIEEMGEMGVTAEDLLQFAGIIFEASHEIPIIVLQWLIDKSEMELLRGVFQLHEVRVEFDDEQIAIMKKYGAQLLKTTPTVQLRSYCQTLQQELWKEEL